MARLTVQLFNALQLGPEIDVVDTYCIEMNHPEYLQQYGYNGPQAFWLVEPLMEGI